MKLRIYLSADWQDSTSPCPWALCDDAGAVQQSGTSPLAEMPAADECIAIISSARLMCVQVAMPPRARRRWEAALPFIAEEFTWSDPEENHVVPAAGEQSEQRSLLVVDKRWLQAIVNACSELKIPLRRAVPEMLMPELPAASWVLIWNGSSGFIRSGMASGMALDYSDGQQPPLALTLSLNAASSAPTTLQIRFAAGAIEPEMPQWAGLPVALVAGEPWDWRSAAIPNDIPNLLWGAFAPKTRWLEWLPRLRPLLLILFASLLIEAVGTNIEWAMLSQQKTALNLDMVHNFRKAFGENSAVVDPALQMQRNIASLRHSVGLPDDGDFLPLLAQASGALAALPRGSVSAMHYESGKLDINLTLPQEAAIEQLQQRLQSMGLSVLTSGMQHTGKGVSLRMTLQQGGV